MDVMRIAGNVTNSAAESGYVGKTAEPKQEELAAEALPKKDAQCTLHISDEGYRKWEMSQESGVRQNAKNTQQEAAVVQSEREVLPASDISSDEEPGDRMERLQIFLDAYRDVFARAKPKPTKDTDDEKVAALEELRQLKEEQEAVYRKKEAQARELARKQTKTRNIVEKGMRELTIMLESFRPIDEEPKKKASADEQEADEQQNGAIQRTDEESGPDTRETMQVLGSEARQHALRKELAMDTTVDRIYNNLQQNFEFVRNENQVLQKGLERLYYILQQDEVSEADKDAATDAFIKDGKVSVYEMNRSMGMGLERLKNLRTLRIGRPENENVVYAGRAQEAISELADLTAIDEWYQDSLRQLENENFKELAEHIRGLYEQERDPETGKAEEEHTSQAEKTEPALRRKGNSGYGNHLRGQRYHGLLQAGGDCDGNQQARAAGHGEPAAQLSCGER